MLEAKLVVVGGDAKSSEVRLKLPTVIGRGKEAGLTVPHALVSRQHSEIFERDGKLFVRDLGSLNGTFVNNLKIEGEQILGPNQLLTLGNITFRAVYEVAADSLDSTSKSETVSFDEVKTKEVAPQIQMKKDVAESTPGEIDINETVPVDEFKKVDAAQQAEKKPVKKVELEPVKKAKAQPVAKSKPKSKDAGQKASKQKVVESEKIELDENVKKPSASDTDKSFKSTDNPSEKEESISNIFSFDEDADETEGKSVALSALGDLPPAIQPATSFVGNVDLGEDAKPVASQIDPVEIDLGVEKKPAEDDDDPGLGSFLKKLPR